MMSIATFMRVLQPGSEQRMRDILRKMAFLVLMSGMMFMSSGCALLGTALSAGVAYGIYAATHH